MWPQKYKKMERQNNSQLELFSQTSDSAGLKSRTLNSSFLAYIWGYEKTILIIIGIIITSVISFSLGVDKGRKISLSNNNQRLDVALKTEAGVKAAATKQVTRQQQPVEPLKQTERQNISEEPKVKELIQAYTIQLASYKTRGFAEREAQALKKEGLPPVVLSKGGYAVLCVGNFSTKQAAQQLLSELKKRYQDCRIRRL